VYSIAGRRGEATRWPWPPGWARYGSSSRTAGGWPRFSSARWIRA